MAKEYQPKKEVLDFIKDICHNKEGSDSPILCAGRKTYSPAQIYEEVKKGTPFGRKFYREVEGILGIIPKDLAKACLEANL
ncbi:MAG: hypothetical protein Q8N63_06135 [Nanoarchaeota archaeon]|nr:hypothetical protein [Nanoarchaeota archaeon]